MPLERHHAFSTVELEAVASGNQSGLWKTEAPRAVVSFTQRAKGTAILPTIHLPHSDLGSKAFNPCNRTLSEQNSLGTGTDSPERLGL